MEYFPFATAWPSIVTSFVGSNRPKPWCAKTGAGMMDCKKALEEAGGDMAKAEELLRVKYAARAEKRADRAAGQGVIEMYLHFNGRVGTMVELNSETDFVARNDAFQQMVRNIAEVALATDGSTEAVAAAAYSGSGKSVTLRSILGLHPPARTRVSGEVLLNGIDLLKLKEPELRKVRWAEASLIPQGAMNSLNPVMQIGAQMMDAIKAPVSTMMAVPTIDHSLPYIFCWSKDRAGSSHLTASRRARLSRARSRALARGCPRRCHAGRA